MKKPSLGTGVALSFLMGLPLGIGLPAQCPGGAGTCHTYTGLTSVSDGAGGPWLTGHAYLVRGTVRVPAGLTLTIQPGAIVKFDALPSNFLDVRGTLTAVGTAADPVIFTSFRDDAAGGDHNGDGSATVPAPGDWSTAAFRPTSTACVLEWCRFRYGGAYSDHAILRVESAGIVLRNLVVSDSIADGAFFTGYANPAAVENCAFDRCVRPVAGVAPTAAANFVNNTGTSNSAGDVLYVNAIGVGLGTFSTNTAWTPANSLNGNGVFLVSSSLTVSSGRTWTLQPGVIVKWANPSAILNVIGTLAANGSAASPVVFTTVDDDAYGGDSTNDGPTSGVPGSWGTVLFQSTADASTLSHTVFRYGGGSYQAMVQLTMADISMTSCTLGHSGSRGLQVSSSHPTVTACAFDGNATDAVSQLSLVALQGFTSNTASGNGNGDGMLLGGGSLAQAVTLAPASAFNGSGAFVLDATIDIAPAGVLTITAGVVIKGNPASTPELYVEGTLLCQGVAGNPVVFTSLTDDSVGGDLNGDGGATTPAAGDWSGVRLYVQADASVLSHTRIRYAGAGGAGGLDLQNCDCHLDGVAIDHCLGAGLDAGGSTGLSATGCSFDDCGAPIVNFPLGAITGLVNCTAAGNVNGNALRIGGSTVAGALVLTAANTLNGDGVLVGEGTISVPGGATLTLDPGLVIKWNGPHTLSVAGGSLVCNGTAANPVHLTALADDSVAGDTGNDGSTTGSPGTWRAVNIPLGAGSSLTHTVVRFAGQSGSAAVIAGSAAFPMDHVRIEKCLGPGLDLAACHLPMPVTGCAFDECTVPVVNASFVTVTGFSGNTAVNNGQGDVILVSAFGSHLGSPVSIAPAHSLNASGVFVLTANVTSSAPGFALAAGVILKFAGACSLFLNTPLTANGTAASPVVFTSASDGDHGGHSLGGPAASGQPGDWPGLVFQSSADGSVVTYALIRFAGEGGVPAVELQGADVSFCNVVIERCLGPGLDANMNSAPVLKNVSLLDNGGEAITGITWAVLGNMVGTVASGNGGGNATVIDSPLVDGDLTIHKENILGTCIVVNVTPVVNATNSLSFGRGVVVKCAPDVAMPVKAVLGTGPEKVVFTSLRDDTIGGDTNGDGGATTPAPGDWIGVACNAGPVEHALIRWAGAASAGFSAGLRGTPDVVRSVRAERCAGDGFLVLGALADNLVAFENQARGIATLDARNCTSVGNGGAGIHASRALYCISWDNGPSGHDNYTYSPDVILIPPGTNPVHCCGTSLSVGPPTGWQGVNCGNTGWNNIDVDPLFVDRQNGDLRLSASSPCRNYVLAPVPAAVLSNSGICKPWGPAGYIYPDPLPTGRDHLEYPRAIDDDQVGPAPMLADLGAFERHVHSLVFSGDARIGTTVTLALFGGGGAAYLIAGIDGQDLFVPGVGWLLIDPASLIDLGVVPLGVPLPIPIPALPGLHGALVSLQALVVSATPGAPPDFTNVHRVRIHL